MPTLCDRSAVQSRVYVFIFIVKSYTENINDKTTLKNITQYTGTLAYN